MSFYSDTTLSKRGPLGKVWLASHLERKLSKAVLLQTNIPNSVTAILGPDDVPVMALRISGQLLLGVARIYSRKAKYLMDDCSDALVKIKIAFRSAAVTAGQHGAGAGGLAGAEGGRAARGDVDMPEDQQEGARANINLNIGGLDRNAATFDMLYNAEFGGGFGLWDDFAVNPQGTPASAARKAKASNVSKQADITLREDHSMYGDDEPDLTFGGSDAGIGSQEYRALSVDGGAGGGDLNLGIDLDLDLDLELDLELDLGLMDAGGDDMRMHALDRQESPAATAAQRAANAGSGGAVSRVAKIAEMARARSSSEAPSEVPSLEYGRDAPAPRPHRDSIASELLPEALEGLDKSVLEGVDRTLDSDVFDGPGEAFVPADETFDHGMGADFQGDGGELDLGLNDGQRTPRAGSPAPSAANAEASAGREQTEQEERPDEGQVAPEDFATAALREDTPPADGADAPDVEMTPRTANRVAEAAAQSSAARKRIERTKAKSKPTKVHRQIVDAETDLAARRRVAGGGESQSQSQGGASVGAGPANKAERLAAGLIAEPQYLPSSLLEMRFRQVHQNPGSYFFPDMAAFAEHSSNSSANKENGRSSFYAGPPGLPKELQTLFTVNLGGKRDATSVLGAKRAAQSASTDAIAVLGDARKRVRTESPAGADVRGQDPHREAGDAAGHANGDDIDIDLDVELGRDRQSSIPAFEPNDMPDFNGVQGPDDTFASDFALDLPDQSVGIDIAEASRAMAVLDREKTPSHMGSIAPSSRRGSVAPSAVGDAVDFGAIDRTRDSILAVFDSRPAPGAAAVTSTPRRHRAQGSLSAPGTRMSEMSVGSSVARSRSGMQQLEDETQASVAASTSAAAAAAERGSTGGWNRNTVKALRILESELQPEPEEGDAERGQEKVLSFERLADKASSKAAASMFFEMLILGTRDCIKLDQPKAYGDISVQAKPKLWEVCEGLDKLNVAGEDDADRERERERERTPTASIRSRRSSRSVSVQA